MENRGGGGGVDSGEKRKVKRGKNLFTERFSMDF